MIAELFILDLDTETPQAKHTRESHWNSAHISKISMV